MVILAMNYPPGDLRELADCLRETYPAAKILEYADEMLAFQYIFDNPVDVVFTGIYMKRLNGFDLARMIRQRQPEAKIFFVAEDDADEADARRMMIDGYFVRPVTPEALRTAFPVPL